ncbi:MAG: FeoB-associated Cys-rich membrane protein, partial [Clostridia bacterium]|nr:FeoB-associated Cys-rich membrane protein [Clostridia bacterium]
SKQLAANPKAEISAFHNGIWIRLAGELVEDDRERRNDMSQGFWYILAVLILGWTAFCGVRWYRQRKKGSCGSCGSCPYSGNCHKQDKK